MVQPTCEGLLGEPAHAHRVQELVGYRVPRLVTDHAVDAAAWAKRGLAESCRVVDGVDPICDVAGGEYLTAVEAPTTATSGQFFPIAATMLVGSDKVN